MESYLLTIFFIATEFLNTIYGYSSNEPARACGDHLADVLALVCKDRGYNFYFSPDDSYVTERRYKRGIVEECCHNGCSYHTLEQYCKPITTETPDNSQIRKRSDNDKSWQLHPDMTADKTGIMKNLFTNFHHRYNFKKTQQYDNKNLQEFLMGSNNNNDNNNSNNKEQKDPTLAYNNEKDLFSNLIFSRNENNEQSEDKKDENKNQASDFSDNNNNNSVSNNYDVNDPIRNLLMFLRLKHSSENLNRDIPNSDEKKLSNDNDKNKLITEEMMNSSELNSFIDVRHRKLPENIEKVERVRHSGEKHHRNNLTSRRNNYHSNKEDSQQKQDNNNNRSVFSRVGIVNPYFYEKGLVHPNVRPSVNFTVNLRQHAPLRKR
ncbi:uncharacterized protein LOC142332347 [Lycorma delicatula]|uniref:uncharacterized protein LOC142332347 n=1 Tax=Lycorma delicatula TaxID=130591 RepID=UPI003F51062E